MEYILGVPGYLPDILWGYPGIYPIYSGRNWVSTRYTLGVPRYLPDILSYIFSYSHQTQSTRMHTATHRPQPVDRGYVNKAHTRNASFLRRTQSHTCPGLLQRDP